MISPTSIVERMRLSDPEILQSPPRVREFLKKNYPELPLTEVMSVDRLSRKYRNKKTPLEEKLENSIMVFR